MEHAVPRKKKAAMFTESMTAFKEKKKAMLFSSFLTFFSVEGSLNSSQILGNIFYPYQSLSAKSLSSVYRCGKFNDSKGILGLEFNYYLVNLNQFLLIILSDMKTCMFCMMFQTVISLIHSAAIWTNLGLQISSVFRNLSDFNLPPHSA